jgi:lysophospholipase L1-like esterase
MLPRCSAAGRVLDGPSRRLGAWQARALPPYRLLVVWKQLALVPLGILLGLLLLEAGLQVAAFFVQRATHRELPVAWVTGNLRVLCLGDSNTYGIWLDERSQAWPQQLEALWNQQVETPKIEALNLGFPGTNSSRLARDLPRLLETFAPDVVLVMVGVNDHWTMPYPIEGAEEASPRPGFLKRHSLLYKLYYLIRRGREARELEIILDPEADLERGGRHKVRVGEVEFEMGYERRYDPLVIDRVALLRNFGLMVAASRNAGAAIHLMTYPSRRFPHPGVSRVIREASRDLGVPLVDLAATFASLCPRRDCPDKFFHDGHPRASGYRIVAESVLRQLAKRDRS